MAWRRQAHTITWGNVDPDLCRNMASLAHSESIHHIFYKGSMYRNSWFDTCGVTRTSNGVLALQLKQGAFTFWKTFLEYLIIFNIFSTAKNIAVFISRYYVGAGIRQVDILIPISNLAHIWYHSQNLVYQSNNCYANGLIFLSLFNTTLIIPE